MLKTGTGFVPVLAGLYSVPDDYIDAENVVLNSQDAQLKELQTRIFIGEYITESQTGLCDNGFELENTFIAEVSRLSRYPKYELEIIPFIVIVDGYEYRIPFHPIRTGIQITNGNVIILQNDSETNESYVRQNGLHLTCRSLSSTHSFLAYNSVQLANITYKMGVEIYANV